MTPAKHPKWLKSPRCYFHQIKCENIWARKQDKNFSRLPQKSISKLNRSFQWRFLLSESQRTFLPHIFEDYRLTCFLGVHLIYVKTIAGRALPSTPTAFYYGSQPPVCAVEDNLGVVSKRPPALLYLGIWPLLHALMSDQVIVYVMSLLKILY